MIIAFSGRKQSGKSTAGNLIYSMFLAQLGISKKVLISDDGSIVVSDLLGKTSYSGVFLTNRQYYDKSDVVYDEVFDILDPIIKIYNFADPLKTMCIDIFGFDYKQCYGSDEDKNQLVKCYWPDTDKQMTAREVLQYVGTDVFRKMHQNVWAESTIRKIKQEKSKLPIITDCRFPNEVDVVKNCGGKIIRLTRNPFNSDHISESILDEDKYDWSNFTHIIDNKDISLYDQCDKIKTLTMEILKL